MTNRKREYIDFLKKRFDENKFIEFISDLLNLSSGDINPYVSEQKPEQKQFRNTIEYYKFISNYETNSNRIGTFIVKLTNEGSQNARTSQRTFISTLLNKYNLDASLVAFYQDNELSWRLSFVKKELSFTEKGIKVDLTPAKRFSYLVGENESVHTAQEYLFSLLDIEDRKITLSDIEKVFDVEKVTKKFFEEYKEKYLELKEFLDKNDDFITESEKCDFSSEEFAKKLMGQIVFLYFLQKKGWLGVEIVPDKLTFDEYNKISKKTDSVCNNLLERYYIKEDNIYKIDKNGLKSETIKDNINNFVSIFKGTKHDKAWGTGDKHFIRNIFKKSRLDHKNNFFDDYLEPLFYAGLNKKRDNHYFVLFNCKIPFLNGGLFEPINNYWWSSAQFNIPDEMFSNDKETGILDIFDLYNFTIDEDEPLEKDIAVDPEMLGKIFENLLDVKDRKSTGSFYTPREIVHYMCQESLANYIVNKLNIPYEDIISFIKYGDIITQTDWTSIYNNLNTHMLPESIWDNLLQIDKALIDVKIADPAVGSGAFSLGMLNEIVKLRDNISSYILIQEDKNIIFREDISQEQLIRDTYSMKLQTIQNSIYAVDIEMSAVDIAKLRLWLSLIVDHPNNHKPRPLPNLDCKIMQGNSLLDEYNGVELFNTKMLENHLKKYHRRDEKDVKAVNVQFNLFDINNDIDTQMKQLIKYQEEYFITQNSDRKKELKKLIEDIQFGMISLSVGYNVSKIKQIQELIKKKSKPWFIWKMEFFDVFKNNNGFDIIIGNPPYGAKFSNKEKAMFKEKYNNVHMRTPDSFNYFISLSISLLNSKGILSFIVPNNMLFQMENEKTRDLLLNEHQLLKVINIGDNAFEHATVPTCIFLCSNEKNKNYDLEYYDLRNTSEFVVKGGYVINSNKINHVPNCIFGIKPEEINIIDKIKNKSLLLDEMVTEVACGISSGGDKIFKVSDETIAIYNLEKEYLYPLIYGRQLNKYSISYDNSKIIYLERNTNKSNIPNIINYLSKYKDKLSNRSEVKTNNIAWYNMNRPRFKSLFENPKIVIRQTADSLIAAYDDKGYYALDSILVLQLKNEYKSHYQAVLGTLNSKVSNFVYKLFSQENGRTFPQVKPNNVRKMYIPISNDIKEKIENFIGTNSSLSEKMDNINLLLYEYYDFNDDEISIIENMQ